MTKPLAAQIGSVALALERGEMQPHAAGAAYHESHDEQDIVTQASKNL